jgi:hypothetical protein
MINGVLFLRKRISVDLRNLRHCEEAARLTKQSSNGISGLPRRIRMLLAMTIMTSNKRWLLWNRLDNRSSVKIPN